VLRTAAKAIIRQIPAIDYLVDHLIRYAHSNKLPPMERWKAGLPSEVAFGGESSTAHSRTRNGSRTCAGALTVKIHSRIISADILMAGPSPASSMSGQGLLQSSAPSAPPKDVSADRAHHTFEIEKRIHNAPPGGLSIYYRPTIANDGQSEYEENHT